MVVLLKCKDAPAVHFGLQCASWVRTSAGSTKRCILAPMGDPNAKSVQQGNLMVARQVWMLCLNYCCMLCLMLFTLCLLEVHCIGVFDNGEARDMDT